jgi:hypothetical protein
MPDKPLPPRKPSWRNKSASQGKQAWWKRGEAANAASGNKRPWSRSQRLLAAGSALVVLIVLIAVVVLLPRTPRPAAFVLLGASYDDNLALPHNLAGVMALQDLTDLDNTAAPSGFLSWFDSSAKPVLKKNFGLSEEPRWTSGWESFAQEGVVVFLALHGGVAVGKDDKPEPFLFLTDPTGGQRLPLEKILDHLDEGALKEKKKLLILDPTQSTVGWTQGQLDNDFVRQVKKVMEERSKDGQAANLFVLCASGVDQRSWVSEEWRRSIFAHFVIEGLKGAADSNDDKVVTLLELKTYVQKEVKQWAHNNRNAVQEPILLPDDSSASGFQLTRVETAYQKPEPTGALSEASLKSLLDAWTKFDNLRAEIPSPAAYTPHLWHQYQETLLRYEQMLRFGDPTTKAAKLLAALTQLEEEMRLARQLDQLDGVGNALPLASTLGLPLPMSAKELDELRVAELWSGDEKQREARWKELKAWREKGEKAPRLVQVQLSEQLLQSLIRKPVARADLALASEVLHQVSIPGSVWPIEAHYLAMLHRDLPEAPQPSPPPELLQTALRTRMLAEQAVLGPPPTQQADKDRSHVYSEAVFPWIREEVKEGDDNRRLGEDLLFASRPEEWTKAREYFVAAVPAYEEATKKARKLREALRVRDELFDELPAYTNWAVRQRLKSENEEKRQNLVTELKANWVTAHLLAAALAKGPDRDQQWDQLPTTFDSKIRDPFLEHCRKLNKAEAILPTRWQEIEDALIVPFIPAKERLSLLKNSRHISSVLNDQAQKPQEGEKPSETTNSGRPEGLLALARLGEDFSTSSSGKKVTEWLAEPAGDEDVMVKAGSLLEKQWRSLQKDTDTNLRSSLGEGVLNEASTKAFEAERLGRQLDGASAALLHLEERARRGPDKRPIGPGEAARSLKLHRLLLWQLDRTADDHWYAENPSKDVIPYYVLAAKKYLADAEKLAVVNDDEAIDVKRRKTRALADGKARLEPTGLRVTGARSDRYVTSEREVLLSWKVERPANGKESEFSGIPVVWNDVDYVENNAPKILRPAKLDWHEEKNKEDKKKLVSERLRHTLPVSDPVEVEVTNPIEGRPGQRREIMGGVALRGRYRGQVLDEATKLHYLSAADLVVSQLPGSEKAGVAFRAEPGALAGQLAVVLDASPSMGTVKPWNRDVECKYHDATTALRRVLKRLPAHTRLSIWVFGGGKVPSPTLIQPTSDKPIDWDPTNPHQLNKIMDYVEDIKPEYGESPIVKTMIEAKNALGPPGDGPRTMLVLTDGMDNESGDASGLLVKEFKNEDILLNVVLFRVVEKEREEAYGLFGRINKFKKPGTLLPDQEDQKKSAADQTAELPRILEKMLIPRARLLRKSGGPLLGNPDDGVPVSPGRQTLFWLKAPPINLTAKVGDFQEDEGRVYQKELSLQRGDRLLVALRGEGWRNLRFERAPFAEEPANTDETSKTKVGSWGGEPSQFKEGWQASILQNGDFGTTPKELQVLVALESLTEREKLQQVYPGFRWIEVKPKEPGKNTPLVRWYNDERYPAPVWQVLLTGWPVKEKNGTSTGQAPEVNVWWQQDPTPPGHAEFRVDPKNPEQTVKILDQEVYVECDFKPKYEVWAAPDRREYRSCLILRISHKNPPDGKNSDNLVWAHLPNHKGGEEHQYFSNGRQYTAIFWDFEERGDFPRRVQLTSLKEFKKKAWHVEFKKLPEPTQGETGPEPPKLPELKPK